MTEEQRELKEEPTSTELVIPSSLPVALEERTVVATRRSGLPPIFWTVIGAGLGIAGTMAMMANRPEQKRTLVAQAAPLPSQTTLQGGGAPMGIQMPAQTASLSQDPPEAPMNPFGGSSFVLPRALSAGAAPKGPPTSGLSGMILPKNLPTLPPTAPGMITQVPAAPQGFNAPTGKAGSAYINKLLGGTAPTAPPSLKAPSIFGPAAASTTKPTAPNAKAADKSTLVTVNQLAGGDKQGAADELIEYVQKIGGKAQPLTEQGSDGKPEVKGVLATVPEAVVKDLLKHVADAGAVVDKQTWSGPSEERKAKLMEDARSRIASLKKLREALLVTYLEDAQPVKDVDEEIAKATKSVDQLQTDKGADKMAIVRISFVNKS